MNIAIINTLAKFDSTGKIAYSFQRFAKEQGHNAYIFYGRDDHLVKNERDIIRIGNNYDLYLHALMSRVSGMQGVFSSISTKNMLKQFKELKIDAVCMLNLHGYYINMPILFEYLGKNKIPCEYVMLDEYPFLGKCTYSFDCERFLYKCEKCPRIRDYPKSIIFDSAARMFNLKKDCYKLVPQCVFVGVEYTVERAKKSAITKNCRFAIADEAVDLRSVYYPRDVSELRIKHKIPNDNKVILTVSPYPNERKGSQFFLEAANRMANCKNTTFVHVGFNADTSICPPNYIPVGYVKDQDLLAQYYSLGDLFVHTSSAETIPASIIEALSCGTPVLGFKASGIPYSADKEHGTFVNPGNVDEMIEVIKHSTKKDNERIQSCRQYAESRYDSVKYNSKLLKILQGDLE